MEILQCMEILLCMSINRLYTKILGLHLFRIFIIKMPPVLAALAPLGILIVKLLTNVFYFYMPFR